LNSQQVLQALMPYIFSEDTLKVWDCCAASGGKSILIKDHFPRALLTVSDIRKSILINLQKRFDQAVIKKYRHFVADISDESFSPKETYDLIVCDAPCSGSGTWSRTPEQLEFFKKEKIEHYSTLQKKIVQHAARALRKKGYFLYITCSVFKEENEEVVNFIQGKLPLKLLSSQYYKGYQQKADTLFSALFSL
ncbi:MAG: methyltransferase domain-containing protein, partial [Flavisolibacter sp.]